jgi:hypothetical protein
MSLVGPPKDAYPHADHMGLHYQDPTSHTLIAKEDIHVNFNIN